VHKPRHAPESSYDGTQSNSDMVFLQSAYKAVLQEAMLKQHLMHTTLVKAFQSPIHYLMIRQSSRAATIFLLFD